jgi:hypothetical protein
MVAALILLLLASPVLALAGAVFRAAILFWPTMLVFGGTHSHIDWVPALGWKASFLVVMLISLLVPIGSGIKSE